jgi:hypothetical protein
MIYYELRVREGGGLEKKQTGWSWIMINYEKKYLDFEAFIFQIDNCVLQYNACRIMISSKRNGPFK